MDAPWPSLTASCVALARGISYDRLQIDEPTRFLLPWPLRAGLRAFDRLGPLEEGVRAAARLASLGLVDHASMRSRAIDEAILDAWRRGVRQLVVLGAGLDSRAYRLAPLRNGAVFEVDHPVTQRFKIRRARNRPPIARRVFVPVDFERDSLDAALGDAGHDASADTVWVLEGVAMYLGYSALYATLEQARARSTDASELLMTYVEPHLAPRTRRYQRTIRWAFDVLGEPLNGLISTTSIHALAAEAGFEAEVDSDAEDWASRFGGSSTLARSVLVERLLVASVRERAASL